MTGGAFEKVIPMIVGVVVFVILAGILISGFNQSLPSGIAPPDNTVPNRFTMHSVAYDLYKPVGQPTNTWNAKNSTGIVSTWEGAGSSMDSATVEWNGAGGEGPFYTVIVRNNTMWNSDRYPTNGTDFVSQVTYDLYKDFIMVEWARYTWIVVPGLTWWINAISFHDIINNFEGNISSVPLGDVRNSTLFISIDSSWANTESAHIQAIYSNQFNISMGMVSSDNVNWYTVVWYILTFNTSWMTNNDFFAYLISTVVDMMLLLCVLTISQRFIP